MFLMKEDRLLVCLVRALVVGIHGDAKRLGSRTVSRFEIINCGEVLVERVRHYSISKLLFCLARNKYVRRTFEYRP